MYPKHYTFIFILVLMFFLAGCATVQQPESHVLKLYPGDSKPRTELAIIKSVSLSAVSDPIEFVELYGINEERFNVPGGFGDGEFEVHLAPGTHEFSLKYVLVKGPDRVISKDEKKVRLTLGAGHTYMLSAVGSYNQRTADLQWKPVLFDKTRVVTWYGQKERAR